MMSDRVRDALTVAKEHGDTDGAHHKAWVIDQMVRKLTGTAYESWVKDYEENATFVWPTGIAP